MKYYIIAGEASGDLHGSNLIKELKKQDPRADIRCWGGDLMAAAGGKVVKHYKDLAIMGFVEVLMNLRTIFRNLDFAKKDILEYNPDALILIDYPGMNMRIAKWARGIGGPPSAHQPAPAPDQPSAAADKPPAAHAPDQPSAAPDRPAPTFDQPPAAPAPDQSDLAPDQPAPATEQSLAAPAPHFRIIYYISPQVWAWKEGRVKQIRENVDKMLVILPFEKEFYRKWDYEVGYVGHPLVEVIDEVRAHAQPAADSGSHSPSAVPSQFSKPVIALLPGSRKQEIMKKLPVMLKVSEQFPDYQFVVAQAPGLDEDFYQQLLAPYPRVAAVRNQTYSLLLTARAACVTSGTATLETALFGVPEVVCYKGSAISYQIARHLIRVKYISLVNLIMDKLVVRELIQDELTPENLRRELNDLLHNPERRQQLAADYRRLKDLLSQGGHASANAARSMIEFLSAAHRSTS